MSAVELLEVVVAGLVGAVEDPSERVVDAPLIGLERASEGHHASSWWHGHSGFSQASVMGLTTSAWPLLLQRQREQ